MLPKLADQRAKRERGQGKEDSRPLPVSRMKRIFPLCPPLTTSIFAALIFFVSAASNRRGGFFFRRGGAGQLSPAAPLSAVLSSDDQVPTIDVAPLFNEDAAAEERRECVDAIGRSAQPDARSADDHTYPCRCLVLRVCFLV